MIDGITILDNVTVSNFNPVPWLIVFVGFLAAFIIIYIKLPCSDKAKMLFKEVKDFDFIKDIKVECKYYQNKEVNFYGTK